jgi:hypothetical protein
MHSSATQCNRVVDTSAFSFLEQCGDDNMNHQRAFRFLFATLMCALAAQGLWAQHVETKVKNADVVYVEGNDVVLKFTNGEVKQFEIPENYKFTVDGKDVTVRELTPGMKLTATITTLAAPRLVDMVRIVDVGTVWKTVGSNLLIKTPDGENKMYRVPSGGKIIIEGKEKSLDQLHEGDKITATVVTTRVQEETGNAVAVVHQPPATPARVGVLLIDEGAKPIVESTKPVNESAKPGEPAGMWGAPTIILLIAVVLLIAALMFLAFRRRQKTGPKKPNVTPLK